MKIPKWLHNIGLLMVSVSGTMLATGNTNENTHVIVSIVGGLGTILMKLPVKTTE